MTIFKNRLGVCYRASKIVNLPVNRVQNDSDNLHGVVHQDELLEKWQQGYQLNCSKLYNLKPESVHQEMELDFIRRH